jgi:diguanylate cyclase (GGDEF)-like protein/PAS domain S-box-containing protein
MRYNYEDMLENLTDGVYFVDKNRKITYWNKAAEKITGFSSAEVVGKYCMDNILAHVDDQGNNLCQNKCPLTKSMEDCISREAEVYLHHKNGHRIPVWIRVTPLRDESGAIVGASELFADISERSFIVERISELEKLAMIDSLTKLSNRAHIDFEIDARFQEMLRYGLVFGILFMDIDHFKQFNDTYGHDAGDLVLQAVSSTLKKSARPFDLYGRWGGEEFIGIIKNVDAKSLVAVAERCRILVETSSVRVGADNLHVTISIGATLARKEDTPDVIVKRADRLLYQSKAGGRNRVTADI